MGRPISERLRDPAYWYADQLPHLGIGFVLSVAVVAPLAHSTPCPPVVAAFAGGLASIGIGVARELSQNWGDAPAEGSVEDAVIDLGVWALGALLGQLGALGG